jgi:hypothetical protein
MKTTIYDSTIVIFNQIGQKITVHIHVFIVKSIDYIFLKGYQSSF